MNKRSPLYPALALCLAATTACSHLGKMTPDRQAFDPGRCQSGTFDVYFKPAQATLSAQAKAQIDAMRHAMSGCRIDQISVVGLPDAAHDPRAAQALSNARADAIVATLGEAGIPRDKLRVLAASGTDAADGRDTASLMRRRALIAVQAAPLANTGESHLIMASGQ